MFRANLPAVMVGAVLTATLVLTGSVIAAPPSEASGQALVCRDFDRPGSRVQTRVCGTAEDVAAYEREDFDAKAMDGLSGGTGWCYRTDEQKRWIRCSNNSSAATPPKS